MDRILSAKHQGVRSFYALFQTLKLRNVELSDTVNNLLSALLAVKDVCDISLPPVVNEFRQLKEILDSLQAAQDEASRDLYVLYFHPTAAGEALYKQLKSATAMQNLDVGKDMMESKGTIQTFESAVKAVEKHKKENEQKTKKEKEQKDAKASSGRGQQPSNPWKSHRGGGRGRSGGGRGDGWASAQAHSQILTALATRLRSKSSFASRTLSLARASSVSFCVTRRACSRRDSSADEMADGSSPTTPSCANMKWPLGPLLQRHPSPTTPSRVSSARCSNARARRSAKSSSRSRTVA